MMRTLFSMLTVMALTVGLCVFSQRYVSRAADEIDGMRTEVLEMTEDGDREGAHIRLMQMAETWSRYERVLEAIVPHDTLHEVTALIIEGNANLESGDLDDFNRSMALLGESIRHMYAEEEMHLSNIL